MEMNEKRPLVERIPFKKILVVLAVIFGISLGACGAAVFFSSPVGYELGKNNLHIALLLIDGVVIMSSAACIVLTLICWLILCLVKKSVAEDAKERQ